MESKKRTSNGKLPAKATKWLLWGGLAIVVASFFIPGQFCMDGCSFATPNLALTGLGLILVGSTCVTYASKKNSYRATLIFAAVMSFVVAVDALATSINGWFSLILVFAEIMALPFVVVGFIIWGIARSVSKNRKLKQATETQAPSVE